MTAPASNEALKKLEEDLKHCQEREDPLDAIDIYEEIQAKGWITPPHLVGMGECLLKLRRKQDAKEVLLGAYRMDNACSPAMQLLEENFPGWRSDLRAPEPPRPKVSASSPAGPSPRPAHPAPSGRTTSAPPPQAVYAEAAINWNYVLEDVAEARSALESESLQKGRPAI